MLYLARGRERKEVRCRWSESHSVVSDSIILYSPWNSLGQNTRVGSLSLLQGIFPTQESNPGLPHCRLILCQLSHKGIPRILEWVVYPFSSRSSWPRNWTRVSCIAGGFFTNWTIREALFPLQNCLISIAHNQNRAEATGFISETPCPIPMPAFPLVLGQHYKRIQGNFGGWNLLFWLW